MKNEPHLGLARKYRPQLFEELVGQEAVATTLKNAIDSKQMAHAYLFYGPKGVGKTTSARILAKGLNCKDGPTPTPCGKCPSCVEIAGGTSIDVLELDAASHTQVDKIREMIIETVALAPSRDRFKVFIVDEVHMLSTSSFNALLKTLEEPPPHVVFILATTELSKIPATIVSRCQRFRFRPLPREIMAEHLKRLAKEEKVAADDKALELLARAAGGSLRDAVSLFDQAAAYAGGKITAEKVGELMGTLPEELLLGLAKAVLDKDAAALAQWLGRVSEEGFDSGQLLRDLRERFQELYLHRLGARADEPAAGWKALAQAHSAETFLFLVKRLNKTLEELRFADSPQLAFELGIYGMLESAYDLRQWVERLEALEKRLGAGAAAPAAAAYSPAPAARPAAQPAAPEPPRRAEAPAQAHPVSGGAVSGSSDQVWAAVLRSLDEKQPLLAAALDGTRLLAAEGQAWRLGFSMSFNLDRAKSNQAAIEAELKAAAGKDIRISFELLGQNAPSGTAAQAKPAKESRGEDRQWVDTAQAAGLDEDPGVKKVLGVLGGRVKSVKKPKE